MARLKDTSIARGGPLTAVNFKEPAKLTTRQQLVSLKKLSSTFHATMETAPSKQPTFVAKVHAYHGLITEHCKVWSNFRHGYYAYDNEETAKTCHHNNCPCPANPQDDKPGPWQITNEIPVNRMRKIHGKGRLNVSSTLYAMAEDVHQYSERLQPFLYDDELFECWYATERQLATLLKETGQVRSLCIRQ